MKTLSLLLNRINAKTLKSLLIVKFVKDDCLSQLKASSLPKDVKYYNDSHKSNQSEPEINSINPKNNQSYLWTQSAKNNSYSVKTRVVLNHQLLE